MPAQFQDVVSLSASNATSATLIHHGNELQIGASQQSTVTLALANSAGTLALVAAPSGNGTVNFPTSGGTLLTNVNLSAGTTSSNVSAWTYSNANNVSFGFDGTNITATATVATSLTNINISAGTTSNNLSKITFSNSNGVSFGLNGSTLTGSVATSLTNINISAGTTSNNLSAVTFSNSNNVTFGLNGSTVTASVTAGPSVSSWAQGHPADTYALPSGNGLTYAPITFLQNITITNVISLANYSIATNSSAVYSVSFAFYTVNGSSLSLVSSNSFVSTISSGAGAGQAGAVSGVQYRTMSIASWAITPGVYVFAHNFTNTGAALAVSGYASVSSITINGGASVLTNIALPGVSSNTTAAFPASVALSDTVGYKRTGNPFAFPYLIFQGS